jgi:phosphoglucomutase
MILLKAMELYQIPVGWKFFTKDDPTVLLEKLEGAMARTVRSGDNVRLSDDTEIQGIYGADYSGLCVHPSDIGE